MRYVLFTLTLLFTLSSFSQQNTTINCSGDPVSTTFCYNTGLDNSYTFTSNDGTSLNLFIIHGEVESNWDELEIRDSDGTILYSGYGNNGNLTGLSFQSSGDTITLEVVEDSSISCVSASFTPIYFTVSCSGLSISDEQVDYISIYPNPSSKYINVNIDSELESVVFDLLGKELIRENISGRIDISSLEKGTYILNLSDGVNTSNHKIIKE